ASTPFFHPSAPHRALHSFPTRRSSDLPGKSSPSYVASPSPTRTKARCASGARSPEAPTDPCEGMRGTTPPLMSSASVSIRISRRSEEHTSELQSRGHLVCRLLLEKKKK